MTDPTELPFEGTLLQLYERLLRAHDHLRAGWPGGGHITGPELYVLRSAASGLEVENRRLRERLYGLTESLKAEADLVADGGSYTGADVARILLALLVEDHCPSAVKQMDGSWHITCDCGLVAVAADEAQRDQIVDRHIEEVTRVHP